MPLKIRAEAEDHPAASGLPLIPLPRTSPRKRGEGTCRAAQIPTPRLRGGG